MTYFDLGHEVANGLNCDLFFEKLQMILRTDYELSDSDVSAVLDEVHQEYQNSESLEQAWILAGYAAAYKVPDVEEGLCEPRTLLNVESFLVKYGTYGYSRFIEQSQCPICGYVMHPLNEAETADGKYSCPCGFEMIYSAADPLVI